MNAFKKYDLGKKRALVFGREYFYARITITQSNENMNNYFKYFKRTMQLYEFVQMYEEAIIDRRDVELLEDYNSRQNIPHLKSRWLLGKEVSEFNQRKIFFRF